MSQALVLKSKGLFTDPNPLSSVPLGALLRADNVILRSDDVIEPRRGNNRQFQLPDASDRAYRYAFFQGHQILSYTGGKLARWNGSILTTYSGTYNNPDATLARVRFLEAANNLYVTTNTGIYKLDSALSTPAQAGVPKALDVSGVTTGSSGFLPNNSILVTTGTTSSGSNQLTSLASTTGIIAGQYISGTGIPGGTTVISIVGTTVTMSANASASAAGVSVQFYSGSQTAYRVVWGIRDANNNLLLGAPSGRAIVINTESASRDVVLTLTVPSGITTAHFFQVYRAAETATSSLEPSDELGLVYERNPTSGEIAAKTISFTDLTPSSLRGATLYTSQSQEGIQQANEPPPLAKDFAFFKGSVFYANTTQKQRLFLTIIAVGGTSGIALDDTLVINSVTYTAKSSETIASGYYKLYTGGTPSQNITDTANSLVRVINQYASNTGIYAYYLSGVNELPGKILLEERGLGGLAFSVTASAHSGAYNPPLPASGTSVTSSKDEFQNQLCVSKSGQPEAVPLVNTVPVGTANKKILRVLALRDSLFIFKEKEGIYRITDAGSPNPELFDSSAKLLAPDTAVILNNQIWCLTDQGMCVVTETGVQVVSRPIEDLILNSFGESLDGVRQYSFGVAYESERLYLLWTISNAADTFPTQCFAFNTFTNTFTRLDIAAITGLVSPEDDKLYLGDARTSYQLQERKNRNYTDYADEVVEYTLSSAADNLVYLTSTSEIKVGDRLYQSATVQSLITEVQPAYVTVEDTLTWAPGSVSVYKAYECAIEYAPISQGNPGVLTQFPELAFLFRQARFATISVDFSSDVSPYFETTSLEGSNTGLWALFPWGMVPWGGTPRREDIRTYVPLEKQRCSQLNVRLRHRQAFGSFQLLGISVPGQDTGSTRVG